MRYPVSPWLWVWPPMWPFLLLVTLVWTMLHWVPWILFHVVSAVIMTTAVVSLHSPYTLQVVETLGILWLLVAAHIALYVLFLVYRARSRTRRRAYAY